VADAIRVALVEAAEAVELEQAVRGMNRKRSALQMVRVLRQYAPSDARIGSAGVFTAP